MAQAQSNSKQNKKLIITIIVLIIAIFAGLCVYYLWQNNQKQKKKDAEAAQKVSQLQQELNTAKNQQSEPAQQSTTTPASTAAQPKQATLENIQAAFESKNTAALEGYMAPSVKVVYAASEMAKDLTPVDAVKAMDYVNSGAVGPWDFALSAATLTKYASGDYKTYFTPTTLVGKSSNGYVVAVNFNGDGKINGIFVSASDSLL